MVASAVLAVCRYMETVNGLWRAAGRGRGRREAAIAQALADVCTLSGVSGAPILLSNAIIVGVLLRDTPQWWMKRRTGGTWRDLDIADDATGEYFFHEKIREKLREKLRMSRTIFNDIVAACSPFIERRLTHYREPLQPDLIVVFALYRWATREAFENASSSFGIGRSSGMKAVTGVANAILTAYPDKVAMPTGRRLLQVTRAFGAKGFPNCFGAIDCTHVYVDKPANTPSENYYDREQQFSFIAQVVIDLDMRILDLFMGYPGSVHDQRVLRNSSLFRRAEAGELFVVEPVLLPGGCPQQDLGGRAWEERGAPGNPWDQSCGMEKEGVRRDGDQCMKRWENIFGWYRILWDREKDSGLQSYFLMSTKARKEKGYRFNLDRTLYDAIHIMQGNNQAIHPPNLVDVGNRQGQQSQQGDHSQAVVGGGEANTSASENKEADAGDGCGSRSSSNDMQGKRKNARQLAFEVVTDVMKTHSTVVAESVDRASKRHCDVLQRQCDTMDREVRTHERQCEVLDIGQRMLCDALLKIASALVALRGRVLGRTITFYEMRNHCGKEEGRVFDFASAITQHEMRHYEVDTNGDTILHVSVALGYADDMLHEAVGYATKVGRAIPNCWEGGVDVLADIIDLLMSNIANEHSRCPSTSGPCFSF
ncbi:hypothetical protein CBR_g37620 [Chara braunii]|uniref:DDE Tnp4 domain-containing protein n=1 Tax=Chara braunii TaxID=69332 RepID=A0A388LN93_CHABU|nr:hypothetical protein CBR_g37620 [Chara braunii]|eukprot:GBG83820.1 hypothetical protein CBR_g37620 [Chara braunii]